VQRYVCYVCDLLSKNPNCLHIFFTVPKEWNIQVLSMVRALDSRNSKEIGLYSDYRRKKYRRLHLQS